MNSYGGDQSVAAVDAANGGDTVGPTVPTNSLIPELPSAAELMFGISTADKKLYWDRSHYESPESQMKAVEKSSTLYVGNLAFSCRSIHVRSHFSKVGPVRAIHMGLDRLRRTPCGFGFVEYFNRRHALEAVASLSGTKLDGRVIRVELDAGFQPGRELGRGASGGQVRDDRRGGADPARSKRDTLSGSRQQVPFFNNAGDEKRERDDDYPDTGTNRHEKNPRFRED